MDFWAHYLRSMWRDNVFKIFFLQVSKCGFWGFHNGCEPFEVFYDKSSGRGCWTLRQISAHSLLLCLCRLSGCASGEQLSLTVCKITRRVAGCLSTMCTLDYSLILRPSLQLCCIDRLIHQTSSWQLQMANWDILQPRVLCRDFDIN